MLKTNAIRLESFPTGSVLDNLETGSPNKAYINTTLNNALKIKMAQALTRAGCSTLAGLAQKMKEIDIATDKGLPLQKLVTQKILPLAGKKPKAALKKALKAELAKFNNSTTLNAFLGLDQPIQNSQLFQADIQKAQLSALVATTPGLSQSLQEEFTNLYTARTGSLQTFWTQLGQNANLKNFVPALQLTFQLNSFTSNNLPLIEALQNYFQQGKAKTLQDLAKLTVSDWTQILGNPANGTAIPIPATITGDTVQAKTVAYANSMVVIFQKAYPVVALAQNLGVQPAINAPLLQKILANNPGLNPVQVSKASLNLSGLSAGEQTQAAASLELLRREINQFPGLDYKTALGLNSSAATPAPAGAFTNSIRTDLAEFITNAAGFDFQTTNVDEFIAKNPQTLAGSATPQTAMLNQLKTIQRIYRVTSDGQALNQLMGEGFTSAHSISRIPREAFVRQYGSVLGGGDQAAEIHGKAQFVNSQAASLFMRVKEGLSGVSPRGIGDTSTQLQTLIANSPNWSTLFGSANYCECGECMAVDGPAAYFVDLLQFLKNSSPNSVNGANNAGAVPGYSPLDILIGCQNNSNNANINPPTADQPQGRRPDLAYLKLDCENVNTTLPYLDLVNEILESFIFYVGIQKWNSFPNSSNNTPSDATGDELSMNPEFTLPQVYQSGGPLGTACFPLNLPYDRYLDTARIYLNFLGSRRSQLMQNVDTFKATATANRTLAQLAESLNISASELWLISSDGPAVPGGAATKPQPYQLYGYSSGTVSITQFNALGQSLSQTWDQWIIQVSEFLKRTGLAYNDLIALLETQYLNPSQSITLFTPATASDPVTGGTIPVSPCDLNYTVIQLPSSQTPNSANGFFASLIPFVRLKQKLGWQFVELDRVIRVFNTHGINNQLMTAVAFVVQLQTILSLSVDQVLSFWDDINTDGRDSLYQQLFQNKAVLNPVDSSFQVQYQASLVTLPSTAAWPASCQGQIAHANSILSFTGSMSDQQKEDLLVWANGDAPTILAIGDLFNQRWYPKTDVASPQQPISTHVNTILAALQISNDDFIAIAVDAGLALVTSPNVITIATPARSGPPDWAAIVTPASGSTATETVTVSGVNPTIVTIGGDITPGDTISLLTGTFAPLSGSSLEFIKYTVGVGDTPSSIAFNLTAQLVAANVSVLPPGTFMWNSENINLKNLSALYRYSALSQSLGLPVKDLISLKTLMGISPFAQAASVAAVGDTVQFVQAAQGVLSSGFSVAHLNYLYRALPDKTDGLPPLQSSLDTMAVTLSTGLQKIQAANLYSPDPTGSALRKKLAVLLPSDQIDPTLSLINGTTVFSSPLASLPAQITEPNLGFMTRFTLQGGTAAGDKINLELIFTTGPGGMTLNYQVVDGDTLSSIAGNLAGQINQNASFAQIGVSASALSMGTGALLSIFMPTIMPNIPLIDLKWTATVTPATANGTAPETISRATSLTYKGIMPSSVFTHLLAYSSDPHYSDAVKGLYDQSQNILSENMFFLAPDKVYSSSLPGGIPSNLKMPPVPPGQVTSGSGMLLCDGPMANSTRDQLLSLVGAASLTDFNNAVNDLYTQAWNGPSQFLAGSSTTADKYDYVLEGLLTYLQSTQSRSLVKQTVSQALGLDSAILALILEGDPTTGQAALLPSKALFPAAGQIPQPAMVDFLGGLLAHYFISADLSGNPVTQIDPGIDLDGTETAFASAQWFGRIVPPTTDTYSFTLLGLPESGVQWQLWVGDQWVIDPVNSTKVNGPINLVAGQIYDFQMNLLSATGTVPTAYPLQLQWNTSSTSPTTIPATAFVLGADPQLSVLGYTLSSSYIQGGLYSTLYLLNRLAVLINGFSMKANEVAYLSAQGKDFEGINPTNNALVQPFDLSALPPDYYPQTPNQSIGNPNQSQVDLKAVAFFNQWQRLSNLYRLKSSLPSGNVGLFDVFKIAAQSKTPATLSQAVATTLLQATGWSQSDLTILTGSGCFNLTDKSFVNEIQQVPLAACLSLCGRLGISATQFFNWATQAPSPDQAQEIVNTMKAKYSDETWLTIGKPLNDQIRRNSRDALVAYILNMPQIASQGPVDADWLYEYFLIDVQMGPAMLTSRLVQATAAVQLFIQRCLMNLENGNTQYPQWNVSPSQIDADEWVWMQNYRVWQANREVFLYPENWIDPTLRDDRTDIFLELQTELLQGSITADSAETAYLHYLEKLDEFSKLEIVGTYGEPVPFRLGLNGNVWTGGGATSASVHVFGRTPVTPHVYYYRRLDQTWDSVAECWRNAWTAWEKVGVDIQGDFLVPLVWNQRLYLFWPVFTEVTDTTKVPSGTSPSAPEKSLQVQLAWSEYKQGTWTKKQITPESEALNPPMFWWNVSEWMFGPTYSVPLVTDYFIFTPHFSNDGSLIISMYVNDFGNIANHMGDFKFWESLLVQPFPDETGTNRTSQLWENNWIQEGMAVGVAPMTGVGFNNKTVFSLSMETNILGSTPLMPPEPSDKVPVASLVFPQEFSVPNTGLGNTSFFFFQDAQRTYFAQTNPASKKTEDGYSSSAGDPNIRFYTAYHPHTRDYISTLNQAGLDGLMELETQGLSDMQSHNYTIYGPNRDLLVQQGFNDDGTAFWISNAPYPGPAGSVPLYLFSDTIQVDSVFTTSSIPPNGYGASQTGLIGYAYPAANPPAGTVPLYGLVFQFSYNLDSPNSTTVSSTYHFYTIDPAERDKAMNWYGFEQDPTLHDGVLCYVFNGQSPQVAAGLALPVFQLSGQDFKVLYTPNPDSVALPYPKADVDLALDGAYSIYNWELFFHIPFLVATQLSQNQQFEDAQSWFHYIFNPTSNVGGPEPNRFWNFKLFNQGAEPESLSDLLTNLDDNGSADYASLQAQVVQYETNPFDPDAIARLRPAAYQKAVVMKYLDNLIAWGDSLFGQDTRESINEATQLYVLAQQILGPKPVVVPFQGETQDYTYFQLQTQGNGLDSLSNVIVNMENEFPFSSGSGSANSGLYGSGVNNSAVSMTFYFCVPPNDSLLGYWDTVADRLFKIRNSMNLQGQVQQLALFAPPINPALLVQAQAAGVDLSSVLSDINGAVPLYRFNFMLSKALELCAEVRGLGGALLSALEKKDAEALSLLRNSQELAVLQAVLQIKQSQINEAQSNVTGLQDSLAVTQARQIYYQTLVNGGLSSFENSQLTNMTEAQANKQSSQSEGLLGSELSLMPEVTLGSSGAMGSPVVTAGFGGPQLATLANMVAQSYNMMADYNSFAASMAGLSGGWDRRNTEWKFQLQTAGLEITQINDQINAANFRLQISQQDLDNQNLQIGNNQAVQDFLASKFTSEDLYSWMIDQVSGVFFQCYQMAYDLAKRAEACFQYELGLADSNYIQFGYWDSLKQGLLSGEKLYLDLKRLEGAYLDQNKREYEITKSISLVLLDPLAIITLKETGQCLVNLPEAYFDMDYPGHYMRRIKSVGLTIPCVTGPYTSVNCTLTLMQSKIRSNNRLSSQSVAGYVETPVGSDPRFFYNYSATQSVATSTAQNDSGMFEVNFRDERYLPFEGNGAISQWLISMPPDCNAFDFETITDVILNLKYTARDGGLVFGSVAKAATNLPGPQAQTGLVAGGGSFPAKQTNLTRFFSLKHEFPTHWYQFFNPANPTLGQVFQFVLGQERFPFQYRGKTITLNQMDFFLKFKNAYPPNVAPPNPSQGPLGDFNAVNVAAAAPNISYTQFSLTAPQGTSPASQFLVSPTGSLTKTLTALATGLAVKAQGVAWQLSLPANSVQIMPTGLFNQVLVTDANNNQVTYYLLNPAVVEDMYLVCHYSIS